MSAGTYSQLPFAAAGDRSSTGQYMKTMVGLSLALHVMVLLFIAGLRLPSKTERPLAAYDVSLVTMPTPSVKNTPPAPRPAEPEPVKTPEPPVVRPAPMPVPKDTAPPPPQPVRLSPTPQVRPLEPIRTKPVPVPSVPKVRQEAPPPAPAPPPVVRQSEPKPVQTPVPPPPRPMLNRDILRGIALPTEVPKLGQVTPIPAGTPKETHARAQTDMEKMLNNLAVPESTPTATQQPTPLSSPVRTPASRPSMSEEVNRQLQKMEQAPPPAKLEPTKAAPMPESQVASKPVVRTPVTTLRASGVAAGNPYLALVQRKISEHWIAPQIGLSGEQFQVIVKFRLDKTGQVSSIVIERTSGNEYYDFAAIRAVQSAKPLPAFPPDMSQPYFDAHFSFAVGEPVS